jgi:hypothetical protein
MRRKASGAVDIFHILRPSMLLKLAWDAAIVKKKMNAAGNELEKTCLECHASTSKPI